MDGGWTILPKDRDDCNKKAVVIVQRGENEELNSCGSESSPVTQVIGELRKQPLGIISEVKTGVRE